MSPPAEDNSRGGNDEEPFSPVPMGAEPPSPPDAELERLVSQFLDQTLTPEEAERLEERLRDEPAAKDYCARALRFDAALQEALDPRTLEWEETRRIVFDPAGAGGRPALSVQRHQTFRHGRPADAKGDGTAVLAGPAARPRRSILIWITALTVLAAIGSGAFLYLRAQGKVYALHNGDFEAMDLSRSPSGISRSILSWQDNFSTPEAELCDIARVSGGRIYAKSGHNVVRFQDRAFVNQRILNRRDAPLAAKPGMRVILQGYYYTEPSSPENGPLNLNDPPAVATSEIPVTQPANAAAPDPVDEAGLPALRCSLRFVASGYPDMIQYEAAKGATHLETGGWHPLRVELTVTHDLMQPPSDVVKRLRYMPPSLDLTGRELILSLDARTPGGVLYLDDLSIQVLPPQGE